MKHSTAIEMILLHYEEATERSQAARGKPWKWRADDLATMRKGCEAATDEHLQYLLNHWRWRNNVKAQRQADTALERFQNATAECREHFGPVNALD